jgi:hypothetical protein
VSTVDQQTIVPIGNFDCTSGTFCKENKATLPQKLAVNAVAVNGVSPELEFGQYVKDTVSFGDYSNKDTSVLLE